MDGGGQRGANGGNGMLSKEATEQALEEILGYAVMVAEELQSLDMSRMRLRVAIDVVTRLGVDEMEINRTLGKALPPGEERVDLYGKRLKEPEPVPPVDPTPVRQPKGSNLERAVEILREAGVALGGAEIAKRITAKYQLHNPVRPAMLTEKMRQLSDRGEVFVCDYDASGQSCAFGLKEWVTRSEVE